MASAPRQTISGQEAQFINSEIDQESGGNYDAISSVGAVGKYQIMPANLPSWESEAGLPQEDAKQFQSDHSEQDALGIFKLDQYYRKYGPSGAAAAWYSGQPTVTSSQVRTYVDQVLNRMSGEPTTVKGDTSGSVSTGGNTTSPNGKNAVQPADLLQTFTGISTHDILVRGGLIVLGSILLLIGVFRFTSTGQKITATVVGTAKKAATARVGGGSLTPPQAVQRATVQSHRESSSDVAERQARHNERVAERKAGEAASAEAHRRKGLRGEYKARQIMTGKKRV